MPSGITPATELEAVNDIISTIGESPISTLEENEVIDASLALRILRMTSVELQSKGWHFNTEINYLVNPDLAGEIRLPTNTLRVDSVNADADKDLVMRGLRLYDRREQTYNIGAPVYVEMVVGLPYDELTSAFRNYVMIRSGRKFQDRYMGDDLLHKFTKEDETEALVVVKEEELANQDANMLRDSQSVSRILYHRQDAIWS
nr:hypothetical protein [uncultured Cohaesibacter sp.]